jgi:hypothetical protein
VKFFSREYSRAAARLRSWGFPLDEMSAILATQTAREANPKSLAHVTEPTMVSSALVFSHGMRLIGRPDLSAAAYRLGCRFGELVYLLDAFEDRERDAKTGDFNPLLAFPYISAPQEMLAIVSRLEQEMRPAHATRLRASVEERLGLRPRVLQGRCRQSMRDRVGDALAFARSMRERERAGLLKGVAVLASVSVLAFLFPHHARRTESWQQCLGVSMNLMALGAIFAAPPLPPGPARPDAPQPNLANCGSSLRGQCIEGCGEGLCEAGCDSCG